MLLGHFEHVDECFRRDVSRGLYVRVGCVPARTATEFALSLAVGFLAMTTLFAGPRRVSRVDDHHRETMEFSLVCQELPKLAESPSAHLGSLPLIAICTKSLIFPLRTRLGHSLIERMLARKRQAFLLPVTVDMVDLDCPDVGVVAASGAAASQCGNGLGLHLDPDGAAPLSVLLGVLFSVLFPARPRTGISQFAVFVAFLFGLHEETLAVFQEDALAVFPVVDLVASERFIGVHASILHDCVRSVERNTAQRVGTSFQRNSSADVFGKVNNPSADNVIHVAAESGFSVADPLHGAASVLPGSSLVRVVRLPTQRTADFVVLDPYGLNVVTTESLAVAGAGQICYTQINSDKLFDFNWRLVGQVDAGQQVELAVTENQVALALDPVEPFRLVLAVDHRNDLTANQCEQADSMHSLETHQSLIVGHGAVGAELRTSSLIDLKACDGLSDGAHGHLARQSELFAKLSVAQSVDAGLAEPLGFKTDAGSVAGSRIELAHSVEQELPLLGIWQQLQLQGELHGGIVGLYLSQVKGVL